MQRPIIVDNSGQILMFYSVEQAQDYLLPMIQQDTLVAYDCEGRLLQLTPNGIALAIGLAEAEPQHEDELRRLLTSFLGGQHRKTGLTADWLSHASLMELVCEAYILSGPR